jgi:hypothetical protein
MGEENKEKSQYSLYISKNQMALIKDLVVEHMHPALATSLLAKGAFFVF